MNISKKREPKVGSYVPSSAPWVIPPPPLAHFRRIQIIKKRRSIVLDLSDSFHRIFANFCRITIWNTVQAVHCTGAQGTVHTEHKEKSSSTSFSCIVSNPTVLSCLYYFPRTISKVTHSALVIPNQCTLYPPKLIKEKSLITC